MNPVTYTHSISKLLSSNFEGSDHNGKMMYKTYQYTVTINGKDRGLNLISPRKLFEKFHFSQNLPTFSKAEGTSIKRARVRIRLTNTIKCGKQELEKLKLINKNLWSFIFPERETQKSQTPNRKTYFILPTITDSSTKVIIPDLKLAKALFEGPKNPVVGKISSSNIYLEKKTNSMFLVAPFIVECDRTNVEKFVQELSSLILKDKSKIGSYLHREIYLRILQEYGLIGAGSTYLKKNFIQWLYDEAYNKILTSFLVPISRFIYNHKQEALRGKILLLTIHVPNFIDLNAQNPSSKLIVTTETTLNGWEYSNFTIFTIDELHDTRISTEQYDFLLIAPYLLIQIERMAYLQEFRALNHLGYIKHYYLYKAMSTMKCDSIVNYETLESIGDSVLKTITSLFIYKRFSAKDEGYLTAKRMLLISNNYLAGKGRDIGVQYFLSDAKDSLNTWDTPMGKLAPSKHSHTFKEKAIADCVEALVGAAFVSNRRLYEPLRLLKDIKVLQEFDLRGIEKLFIIQYDVFGKRFYDDVARYVHKNSTYLDLFSICERRLKKDYFRMPYKMKRKMGKRPIINFYPNRNYFADKLDKHLLNIEQYELYKTTIFHNFERERLGYSFKNKRLLYSVFENHTNESRLQFQRLEFLGDAVIELATLHLCRRLYIHFKLPFAPADLHGCKSLLLSTPYLSLLSYFLRLPWLTTLPLTVIPPLSLTPPLLSQPFSSTPSLLPKQPSDLLEALFGALFLDGGFSAVWRVWGRVMAGPCVHNVRSRARGVDVIGETVVHWKRRGMECQFLVERVQKMGQNGGFLAKVEVWSIREAYENRPLKSEEMRRVVARAYGMKVMQAKKAAAEVFWKEEINRRKKKKNN